MIGPAAHCLGRDSAPLDSRFSLAASPIPIPAAVAVKMLTLGSSQAASDAEEQQGKLLRQLEKEGALDWRWALICTVPGRHTRCFCIMHLFLEEPLPCQMYLRKTAALPRPAAPQLAAVVMSKLHHPNVCHLLAITRQPACLVMEYASRRSVDKLLAAGLKDAKVHLQL